MSTVSHTAPKMTTAVACKSKKAAKRNIREDEILAAQEASEIISSLPEKRVRKSATDKNQAYIAACLAQQSECNLSGGFKSGSRYHYDREY